MPRRLLPLAILLSAALLSLSIAPLLAGPGSFTFALQGRAFPQVAVDPSNSKIVYLAGNDANQTPYVFKSFDSGNTWASLAAGLGQVTVNALAVSKLNSQLVYLGGYNFNTRTIALYQSTNGGSTWSTVAANLGDNSVQAIALDPRTPNLSYLALNHGVAKSTDGTNWSILSGLSGNNLQSLVIENSAIPILYAGMNAVSNPGVWKSADGGQTWASLNNGLPSGSVFYLALDPTIESTIFAGVASQPGQPAQIMKTVNSGQNWSSLIQTDALTALVVDPLNGLNVYYETQNGLYRSGDGGSNWVQILTSGGGGFSLDTVNPQTLYAGTNNGIATFTAAPPPAISATPTTVPISVQPTVTTPGGSGQSFTFAQTGHTVSGIWFDFLKTHGDTDNLGYPRTEVIRDALIQSQTVQYFQRLVLEYHPEQSPAYQLQRRLLGDILAPGADPAVDANNRPAGDAVYFPNLPNQGLGHFVANIAPDGSPTLFKAYFDSHGREDAFGYPKEEPKQRQLADEQIHWTQRFQAAVFEYHQQNDRDGSNPDGIPYRNFRVQLELLGDEYIARNNLPYR
ncbi:MAG: hypothetical protein EXR58_06750 [Chloroflexi bacterium]|nr:hypothetical protein [Chloroflexota bacterium]